MPDFRQIDKPRHSGVLAKPQELTDDLTASELAEMLEGLRFHGDERRLVRLDRGVRDYLLRAIKPG